MNIIYLKLPYFIQKFIVNIISFKNLVVRKNIYYYKSLRYYRSFYSGGFNWEEEFQNRRDKAESRFSSLIVNELDLCSGQILNKKYVKKHMSHFLKKKPLIYLRAKTSGSSGNGLSFIKSFFSEQDIWAAYDAFREMYGVTNSDWCGYFCGNMILNEKSKKVSHTAYPTRQIIFSQYHLTSDTIISYITELNHKKPQWIHGYPSFLIELIRLAIEAKLSITYSVKLVTTGSESLSSEQKKIISNFFNSQVKDMYCQSEMVAMIFECSEGVYHINEAFSAVNLVREGHGSAYKVIGSNLNNLAFPLLNYDTEDLVEYSPSDSCNCNINGRVVRSICGRVEDYLILPSGQRLGRLDHIFKGDLSIYQAQFIQEKSTLNTKLYLKVDDTSFDRVKLESILELYLPNLNVQIFIVEHIKTETNGKLKFVKQVE